MNVVSEPPPGTEYSGAAYRACLHGRASPRQQQSAASQIILLNGIKGELLNTLRVTLCFGCGVRFGVEDKAARGCVTCAGPRRIIAKAEGRT